LSNVIRIETYKNRDTRKVLEELLAKYDAGELSGLVACISLGDFDHGIVITGRYNNDPIAGAAVAGRALKILSNRADKMVRPGKL
jgi:hypothetical protein